MLKRTIRIHKGNKGKQQKQTSLTKSLDETKDETERNKQQQKRKKRRKKILVEIEYILQNIKILYSSHYRKYQFPLAHKKST